MTTMSEDKRKRSPNWLSSEKDLLLSLVEFHFNIIECKKTDGVSIKKKLAQWKVIADQYNSRTTLCSRTSDNLKSQWESMKKQARKDAANIRKHMIQTGGGPPMPKKEDPLLQRILCLITTSAVGLLNKFDSDSEAIPIPIEYIDVSIPDNNTDILVVNSQENVSKDLDENNSDIEKNNSEIVSKDWGDYTPQLLKTPVSQALKINNEEKGTGSCQRKTWLSRRRPTHHPHNTHTSLELLYKKKIEAIDLQQKLASEEMERSKILHDLDVKIKKQLLRQEIVKLNILKMRRKKLTTKTNKRK